MRTAASAALDLPDAYVWDFWLAEDDRDGRDERWHLFFLQAPRSLGDPELRHTHATVGHAVSADLVSWSLRADALGAGEPGTFDDLAVWTGSVVEHGGTWWMFHSGISRAEAGLRQRIGLATSVDLDRWAVSEWTLTADPRWYEVLDADGPDERGVDEHWRDPWLVREASGRWHMYVTARARGTGPGRGVVGHATSADLRTWQVEAPLSQPTGIFEQLEVLQLVEVAGRWVVVFSCLAGQMHGAAEGAGGCWYVEVAGPGSPVDVGAARRLLDERFYVAKVVPTAPGAWGVMAFRNRGEDGGFVGGVVAPMPLAWDGSGRLVVAGC